MATWKIDETKDGLRLTSIKVRKLRTEPLTWAELLLDQLGQVRVYVLYFPSRFDLELDTQVTESLWSFGRHTPASTSVGFWDPTDPEFSRALSFFDLETAPALVFVAGMQLKGMDIDSPSGSPLYSIALTDPKILGDRERLAAAANTIHEIVARGNPKEITAYLRERRLEAFVETIGKLASGLRDQLLKLKPKLQLPGGPSIQLG